ncbi:hypothetical protein [Nitrosospira sp. Nsp1]|uniref:hypothetical protein n=1 Tax=Nitrosospira sp. Nsp1 TaxID=136547 RepID=UPI00087ECA83|nr:hypothetical protein [Nitrosospira sp. Nsp1]SCX47550.1 hypothetical protein SAMN05720354_10743 [Nitrosospira sp. Nsp1]
MTEFKQAQTVQVRAADLVRQVGPGVHTGITGLGAEWRLPPLEMREKTDHMTSAELQAVIAELRPPDARDLVERDHEILAARQACDSLAEQLRQARVDEANASHQMDNWRFAHPFRAIIHDLGLRSSGFLAEYEEIKAIAETEALKLASRVHDAAEHVANRENEVEARIRLEQAPVREYMTELERLKRQKAARETAERWQTQELDDALIAFTTHALKREMRAYGYGDAGTHWQALPESLRITIDNFNRLPREARPAVLEEDAKMLTQELCLSEEQGQDQGNMPLTMTSQGGRRSNWRDL